MNKQQLIVILESTILSFDGFFILLEQNSNFVKIKTGSNILTIPYHRIKKIKEKANA